MALAAGVVLSDGIFVALSLFGSTYITKGSAFIEYVGYAGAVILLSIGIFYLLKKVKLEFEEKTSKTKKLGYFLKGFVMCIFNPSLLLYWISVTSGVISVAGGYNPNIIIPFFAAILITQFSLDTVKAYFANKLRKRITVHNLIVLNRVAGTLLIIFAAKLIYSLVVNHSLL
jgi:threonine/homoserine/homoserine lactone efflux protein